MDVPRGLTSWVLLGLPIVILNTLRVIITPLGGMMSVSPTLDVTLHIVALAIGIIMFRKTRIVRDHEWVRSKAVKSVGEHFKAEEKGVWEKDVHMETGLSIDAEVNMKGQVSMLTGSGVNQDVEISEEVEVEMLIDSEHVMRAQRRVTGDEQFDDGAVRSTLGATRKTSPMDALIDWISGLWGHDRAAEREAKRAASLEQRSRETPVTAQRPIAPIQPIETDRKKTEMVLTTMTDGGNLDIDVEVAPEVEEKQTLSLEEMAYGVQSVAAYSPEPSSSSFSPRPTCRACSAPNEVGERFCSNCGSNL
ncbi:MAG: zinc ribbon domain-containing protein [Candidatus Poseidoniaceae archaeon]|jgi:hypothetical protein|nr:zinc ribbon domain-containing protein [Candidatus Poseidoniaceae archaeon]